MHDWPIGVLVYVWETKVYKSCQRRWIRAMSLDFVEKRLREGHGT